MDYIKLFIDHNMTNYYLQKDIISLKSSQQLNKQY